MVIPVMIALNVFAGMVGMIYGSKFLACLNFAVVALLLTAGMFK